MYQINSPDFLSTHGDKSVNPNLLLETLTKAINPNNKTNKEALELIQKWERDTVPGFFDFFKGNHTTQTNT